MNKKIGWVITFFQSCDEGLENLRNMVNILSTEDYYLVLASHSTIPEDIQEKCDYVIYEKSNPVDGRKYSHGIPENLAIRYAFEHLNFMGIEWAYKMCYDNIITDIHWFKKWINDYKYEFVTCNWGKQLFSSHSFFCRVQFFLNYFPVYKTFDEMFMYSNVLEICWEMSLKQHNVLDKIFIYPSKEDFFGPNKMDIIEYNYNKIQATFNNEDQKFYIINGNDIECTFDIYLYDYYTECLMYRLLDCKIPANNAVWIIPACNNSAENGYFVEIFPKGSKTKITRYINVSDYSNRHKIHKKINLYKKEFPRFREYFDLVKLQLYSKIQLSERLIGIKSYVDIGANYGFASMLFTEDENCKVYMIDGDYTNIEYLNKNFKHRGNVKILHYAVTDIDGEVKFHINKNASTVSGLEIYENSHEYETVTAPAITPNTLFENHISDPIIDFVKIDIEGGEYTFFSEIDNSHLKRIKRILIEFHENTNKRLAKILEKLSYNDFHYISMPWGSYNDPYILNNKMGIIYAENLRLFNS